ADSADAGEIGGDGENVGQVHLQRVGHALAQLERRHRRCRRDNGIDFLERAGEIAANQFAYLLRAQIIGVVITGTQDVSAKEEAPFYFRAETFRACASVVIEQVFWIFSAITVTHAIEARQIGRGFSGGENVVGGDGVIGRGEREIDNLCA